MGIETICLFLCVFYFETNLSAAAETLKCTCEPWTNAGLRLEGKVTVTLSGLELEWTNGKLSQKAIMEIQMTSCNLTLLTPSMFTCQTIVLQCFF